MGVDEENLSYLIMNIKKAQNNDLSFLEYLLDPLFKEKTEEEILKNMSLVNKIVINQNTRSTSSLMRYEGLPNFIEEISNSGVFDLYSFTDKCNKISSYFNIASKLPDEYHEGIIRSGYNAFDLMMVETSNLYNLEKDIALALGLLAYKDDLNGFRSFVGNRLKVQEELMFSLNQEEDYDDDEYFFYDNDDFDDEEDYDDDELDYELVHLNIDMYKLNDFRRLARIADYSRYELCEYHVENIFPVGKTENMLYSQPVLELFVNNH